MGRTINYTFSREGNTKFNDQEIETFIQVRRKYTTGKFTNVWSCDAFYPEPVNVSPNWKGARQYEIKVILREELNNGEGFDYCAYIENKVEDLMKGKGIKIGHHEYSFDKKLSRFEAYRVLAKDEWIHI